MDAMLIGAVFVGGYVAAVFTWDKIHTAFVGAKAKADALRAKASAIEASVATAAKG